jgi:chromosome segregation protein
MQPLRDEEATRAAVLHRLTVERETLDEEEQRAKDRKQELEDRLAQLESDLERERDREQEAKEAHERLGQEQSEFADAPDDSEAATRAGETMEARASELEEVESALGLLTGKLAGLRAERQQLTATLENAQVRKTRQETRETETQARLKELEGSQDGDTGITDLRARVGDLSGSAKTLEQQVVEAEKALANVREKERAARETAADAKLRAQELETEAQTLIKLLKPAEDAR